MCRSSSEGGRRCPCTNDRASLDAHNERRRRNRALRSAAVSWAEHQGVPSTAVQVLAAAPPSVVASWAQRAGASDSIAQATHRRLAEREISDGSWATPALIDSIAWISRAQGSIPEEQRLSAGEVTRMVEVEEGVNGTLLVELDTGVRGFHKAFSALDDEVASFYGHPSALQPIHEVSAWILARELGAPWRSLIPPTVLRTVDGRLGSFSELVEGDIVSPLGSVPEEHLMAAAFFDSLIGQQDRHPANLLVDPGAGALHLIDHGFAFARPGDPVSNSMFVRRRWRNVDEQLTPAEISALDRIITPPHLGIRALLEPERGAALIDRARRMRLRGMILDEEEL